MNVEMTPVAKASWLQSVQNMAAKLMSIDIFNLTQDYLFFCFTEGKYNAEMVL